MEQNANNRAPLRAAEYTARVLSGGSLEVPASVRHELGLRPGMIVKVILLCSEETPEDKERIERERAGAFRKIDEVREQLSGRDGSLTEALLQAREEEDSSL